MGPYADAIQSLVTLRGSFPALTPGKGAGVRSSYGLLRKQSAIVSAVFFIVYLPCEAELVIFMIQRQDHQQ
jgi:hypothetical protein